MAKKKIKKRKKTKKRKATKRPQKSRKKTVRRPRPISRVVRVKELIVRYGGVIKTGSYKNRRVSYEVAADCPRNVDPQAAFNYIESLAENQFYQAQLKAIEGLPQEERDEIGDIHNMTPQQANRTITEYFRNALSPAQREKRIAEIQKELKELAPKIKKETDRLRRLEKTKKGVGADDIHEREVMINRKTELRKELKILRGK